jgi:hypothetical protein
MNLFQNLQHAIQKEFQVRTKSKVVPYASSYLCAKFGEFCASGRSPF